MSSDALLTFIILGATIALFATDRVRLDVVALLSLLALTLTGVAPLDVALSGFSNPAVLMIAGGIVIVRCMLDFAWTGLGTPFPLDAPRRFVAVGFYRFVRNPMYLGMALVLSGETLLVRGIRMEMFAMIVVLWAAVALLVVAYEEPTLKRLFGDEYEQYLRAVPRWIPRLTPYQRV